ncbi:hypothetical protein ACFL4G_02505 [Thermodesulfobacteriota bacterium]
MKMRIPAMMALFTILAIILFRCDGSVFTEGGAGDGEAIPEYIVGAHYYPWYDEGHHWDDPPYESTHLLDPYLGEYDCGDPAVAEQQIDWAADYGIDLFTLEWWGPNTNGVANLNNGFFQASNLSRIRHCIFYDTMIRMSPLAGGGWSLNIDFSREDIRETFVGDIIGIAETYFDHPQYFRISGRPVMWAYWTLGYTGDFAGAMAEVRSELLARGYDLYLIGDFPLVDLKPALIPSFDAVSVYCQWQKFLMLPFDTSSVGHLSEVFELIFKHARERVTQIPVAGRDDGAMVDFHPGVIPQFDDSWMTGFPRVLNVPVHASSREDVVSMFQVAKDSSEPAYDGNLHISWITSFNEWHETTTIEPTIVDGGPDYPCQGPANYGFDFLDAVREVFHPESSSN